ncbi:DNA-directed RNA polymerase [Candidatus Woesearchaeota archaeon CG08_land_8_20_14_0_20_47_9]|nr:MAG: DNA-directed RNA polymerase [Candidatus Woesearchaeota archaeon CG08_land_8_20_14_0_20_47_9]
MRRSSKGGSRRDSRSRDSRGSRSGGSQRGFGSVSFGRDFVQREMHKAICSECGKECEVPFKPTEGKPVFCRECFQKRKRY